MGTVLAWPALTKYHRLCVAYATEICLLIFLELQVCSKVAVYLGPGENALPGLQAAAFSLYWGVGGKHADSGVSVYKTTNPAMRVLPS